MEFWTSPRPSACWSSQKNQSTPRTSHPSRSSPQVGSPLSFTCPDSVGAPMEGNATEQEAVNMPAEFDYFTENE